MNTQGFDVARLARVWLVTGSICIAGSLPDPRFGGREHRMAPFPARGMPAACSSAGVASRISSARAIRVARSCRGTSRDRRLCPQWWMVMIGSFRKLCPAPYSPELRMGLRRPELKSSPSRRWRAESCWVSSRHSTGPIPGPSGYARSAGQPAQRPGSQPAAKAPTRP